MKIKKNYKCQECGYTQDFNPNDEAKMQAIFGKIGVCPSCGKKLNFKEEIIEAKDERQNNN